MDTNQPHEQKPTLLIIERTEQDNLRATKPTVFPCFVLKVARGNYFIVPLFFVKSLAELPEKLPRVFRVIANRHPKHFTLSQPEINFLTNCLLIECLDNKCNGSLVLAPGSCINLDGRTKTPFHSSEVPSCAHWLRSDEYLSDKIVLGKGGKNLRQSSAGFASRVFCDSESLRLGWKLKEHLDEVHTPTWLTVTNSKER